MSIKKVFLDEHDDECICCGICSDIAPHVFIIGAKMEVKSQVNFDEFEAELRNAADICPTNVIRIVESSPFISYRSLPPVLKMRRKRSRVSIP